MSNPSSTTVAALLGFVCCTLLLAQPAHASNHPAHINNGGGQLTTSSTLRWQAYRGDTAQLENAVIAGHIHPTPAADADAAAQPPPTPMHVCRSQIDGIPIAGHTQHAAGRWLCTVSMHMVVHRPHVFDVLLNVRNGAMLAWQPWSKYNASIPLGAVSASSAGHIDDSFVARRPAVAAADSAPTVDYYVGRFAPREGLGQVAVIEGTSEKSYEYGEILAEIQPTRYELRHIRKSRTQLMRNKTFLGFAQLQNDGDAASQIESVIAFEYVKETYWGTLEGVSRGMPIRVHESGRPAVQIVWGIPEVLNKTDTKAVNAHLMAGTALNVTVYANYTSTEAKYTATLISFYNSTDKTLKRPVESTFTSKDMVDVRLDFSPIYFVHNSTLVPTTTTTTSTTSTTTTTSSTTQPTSTSTQREARPAGAPPLDGDDDDDDHLNGNSIEEEEESTVDSKHKLSAAAAGASVSSGHLTQSTASCSLLLLLLPLMMMLMPAFSSTAA